MIPHWIFSIITLVFVMTQFDAATQAREPWEHTLPNLTDPNPQSFKSVVVDRNNTGDVFVGGINVLYRLSADLELKQNVSIGPVDDYPGCPAPPYPCGERRVPTDNTARILQLVYDLDRSPSLLLCGSVYRNLCQVRPLDNLTEYHWIHPYNKTLGYTTNSEIEYNYALMERGFDGQTSLFTATTVTGQMSPIAAPFLSCKVLKSDGDRYYFQRPYQNNTFLNAVFMKDDVTRAPMDGGFLHEDYIYFTTLGVSLPADHSPGPLAISTRLVRFCRTDPTFRSYQELPLQCNYRGQIMKRMLAAHLGPSAMYNGTKKTLYMSFSDADRPGSAVCVVDMSTVVAAFETWPRVCNRDVVGERCDDKPEKVVRKVMDFCGSNPMFLDGRPFVVNRTLEASAEIYLRNMTSVALTVKRQSDEIIAYIGNNLGHMIKVNLGTGKAFKVNDMLDSKTAGAFVSPFVFDRDEKHIYLLIRNKVIKYPVESCGMYETCHDCFVLGRKADPLQCGWCAGQCARAEECADSFSTDTCTPTIYEVFPVKGPIQGGNTITVAGDSFGSFVDDAHTSISVAGIPCMSSSWTNIQINCTMGSTPEELSGPVKVNVINAFSNGYKIEGSSISETNFSYYAGLRLYGIQPSKGPKSGGTLVKLYGVDLGKDVKDKKCMVSVNGRPCIIQRFDENSVSCIIQNSTDPRFTNTSIAVHVDGVAYMMDENPPSAFNLEGISQTFEFTPDPYITHIRPGITTLSGIMNLTAFGRYLDSVQFPKLLVKIDETQIIGESEIIEDCWTDPKFNGTSMTCRTPSLKDLPIFPPATRTHPFMVQVAFLMDGVRKLRDFPKHREDLSRLLYYPDPEFDVFHELEKIKKDQKMFEIKGKYLDLMHLADNLQVRIGSKDACKIASVSSHNLLCELPQSLFMSSLNSNLSVEVYVGTETYNLGYIDIEKNDAGISIWVFLMVPAVIAICLLAIFLYCRRVHGKKPISIGEMVRSGVPHDYRSVPAQAEAAQNSLACPASTAQSPVREIPLVDRETKFKFADNGLMISEDCLKITDRKIGKGEFGCVYEGYLQLSNQQRIRVAVKTLREHSWSDSDVVNKFLEEALFMLDFHDDHVLGLYGVCFDCSGPSIVLPFMENGDLLSFIRQTERDITKSELMQFAADVSAGMSYLEENRCVHRDLAARNCLLDGGRNVKVADFGLSRDVYVNDYYCTGNRKKAKIPYKWTALESLENCKYTTKSDVWSYGVVVWELMTRGCIPYCHIDNEDLKGFLKKGKRLDRPEYCPMPLYKIMLACWNSDPDKRNTFHELNSFVLVLIGLLTDSVQNEPMPALEIIPAMHTEYHDSEELYLCMEGRHIDRNGLQKMCLEDEQ
ncbi:hypothetical protein JTE90_025411 [Oedothorax gibbosus]|uniref:receptor protein-tyrosine kinase n=1 Tax=Oedothorax gibbosus TaxID=931172 RepID=A0AAV6UJ30_9ARAC|nr:hypothetical protein JTE90_025411 [Oedothorax gibbosus]